MTGADHTVRAGALSRLGISARIGAAGHGAPHDALRGVDARRQRHLVALAAVVTTAIFGPYTGIAAGMRWEHLAVYGTVLALLPFTWYRLRPSLPMSLVLALWGLIICVSLIGLAAPPVNTTGYDHGVRLLASADNLCLPAAAMVLAVILGSLGDRAALLRTVVTVVIAAMTLNTVLALVSMRTDITGFLQPFWTNEQSVADRSPNPAMTMGRLTGIFVMPAEAGAMYGIALLGAVWLLRRRPARLAFVAFALLLGGVLTVSKTFLLGALPLAVLGLLGAREGRAARWTAIGIGLVVFAALVDAGLLATWRGVEGLQSMADPQGGALTYYTAGRLGHDSDFDQIIGRVVATSPVYGMGVAGLRVAYDGELVELTVIGGLLAVGLFLGMVAVLVRSWWGHRHRSPDAPFHGAVVLFTLGASFGIPLFTSDRVGSVLWLVLGLSVLAGPAPDAPAPEPATAAGPRPPALDGRLPLPPSSVPPLLVPPSRH
jgi:hypothetical protein